MQKKGTLLLASFLYKNFFSIYKLLYYSFKKKQDAYEISLLKKYIRTGDTVLDIGSNIGFYTEILAELTGASGKVHCFEPDRNNFLRLKKSTAKFTNIILNECAVSDKSGTITLYVSDLLNVDHRTYKPESYKSEYNVKTISIDQYVNGAYPVDFIKMDIQGAELSALKGMQNTIRNNPDIKILTEFWPYGFIKSGSSAEEIFHYVQDTLSMNIYVLGSDKKINTISSENVKRMNTGFWHNYNAIITKRDLE